MQKITLVTGNRNKLMEWQRIIGSELNLESSDIDLTEIQSLDLKEIVVHKAKSAYKKLKVPVVVEDISCSLDRLNGLPGPFIKFFVKQLGNDCLIILAGGKEGQAALVSCAVAYYDGKQEIVVQSDVKGKCVHPRGESGFGFDFGFIPYGSNKTFAEMTPKEKDTISHRNQAIKKLLSELKKQAYL
ncbi:non-canonical purine NTP pyrophosphatase [Candidatus Saccharibacteria bacterium]|nr:non-canonical purine NTP pyrophosphatase [Candidatus Saccharibacteria bacterium]